jgi:predicted glycoside hydrolase/deacetylase ChbG (UPF0249 family)
VNRKLIITADDYGMCGVVNAAIEECLAAGALRATCVMANMPAYQAAVSLRHWFPRASVGLHWNLTQGRPVLPVTQVASLVDSHGQFFSAGRLRRRWFLRQVRLAEIIAELRAQYHRFYTTAGQPDFWNTHQNIHLLPGLFQACAALGRELGIPAMRCHRRFTVPRDTTPIRYCLHHPLYWLKGQIIARWSQREEARGTLMPDGRAYAPGYGVAITAIDAIVERIEWNAVRVAVEMVVHPATAVQEEFFGDLTESRLLEYAALKDPRLTERLRQRGIETVGFDVLHKMQR